ncbi:lytic transglycosylase domain-containing protein [Fulvivirga sedimenti]|uniref:Lytic transglycosylase domain-containing protein n=1 Tax=Fulvivirga sedimenti TaxID=2879465 RepID=A0A9X1HYX1_9BACT|nr:lytic transglycosylase domain-containing protein [Fulvivirga sedimenti]MCA6079242.1 lytic transglycosylase domain-containing protein [Fulvivirga sedimenti]
MKYFPHAISLLALAVAIGYVQYNESKPAPAQDKKIGFYKVENPPAGEYAGYLNAVSLDLPEKLTFAGEEVPLDVPDVRERLDRELHINTYWHSSTIFLIKHAHRWMPQIEQILKENGIPEDFKYLTAIESGFVNAVSPKQAVGFWQILSTSGKEYGLEITKEVDERYDPLKSTEAACQYLKKAYNKFGSWTSAAASYNRGMAGLQRAMDDQKVDSYYDLLLNDETSRYVFRILAAKEIIEHPDKYGFNIDKQHLYDQEHLRYVEVDEDIDDLVKFAKDQGINYKLLKRHNPWLRQDHLKVRKNKTYKIAIPDQTLEARP